MSATGLGLGFQRRTKTYTVKDRKGAEESLNSEEDKANDRERERESLWMCT